MGKDDCISLVLLTHSALSLCYIGAYNITYNYKKKMPALLEYIFIGVYAVFVLTVMTAVCALICPICPICPRSKKRVHFKNE